MWALVPATTTLSGTLTWSLCPPSQQKVVTKLGDFSVLYGTHSHNRVVSSGEFFPMVNIRACHIHVSIQFIDLISNTPHQCHHLYSRAALRRGYPRRTPFSLEQMATWRPTRARVQAFVGGDATNRAHRYCRSTIIYWIRGMNTLCSILLGHRACRTLVSSSLCLINYCLTLRPFPFFSSHR